MNIPARYFMLIVAVLVVISLTTTLTVAENPTDEENSTVVAAETSNSADDDKAEEEPYVPKSKRELQRSLTRMQYDVTQNEATEPAFRNMYWNNKKEGIYKCVVCGRELFSSKTKFESGTGWPSFYAPIEKANIGTRTDYRLFYARTEVHCARCNAHLGHVFEDGPKPTGLRYCMNSASLRFAEGSESSKDASSQDASLKDGARK